MWANFFGPACCCVDGTLECSDVTYLPDDENWGELIVADGELDDSGTPAKWDLAPGDRLVMGGGQFSPGTDAWFHTVELRGGAIDIKWDGLTFEYRPAAGTISSSLGSSIFIPDSDLWTGWEDESVGGAVRVGNYLTFYVTPNWLSVWLWRQRPTAPGSGIRTQTRGSAQNFARSNVGSPKGLEIEAVGSASVVSWRVADATVKTAGGVIVQQCVRPEVNLAGCTERLHQTREFPEVNGDYDTYECVSGVPCNFVGSYSGGFTPVNFLGDPIIPADHSKVACNLQAFHQHPDGDFQTTGRYYPTINLGFICQLTLPSISAAQPYPQPSALRQIDVRIVGPTWTPSFPNIREAYPLGLFVNQAIPYSATGFASGSVDWDSSEESQDIGSWFDSVNPDWCTNWNCWWPDDPMHKLTSLRVSWAFD